MKTTIKILGIFSMALVMLVTSCKSSSHRRSSPIIISGGSARTSLPPGHAKKVYGHQSAKAFAPGQQKKKKGKTNTIIVRN